MYNNKKIPDKLLFYYVIANFVSATELGMFKIQLNFFLAYE